MLREGKEVGSYFDQAGRKVHVFEDEFGELSNVVELDMSDYLPSGHWWCPRCHIELKWEKDCWVCPQCSLDLWPEDIENGIGCPSLAASYDEEI